MSQSTSLLLSRLSFVPLGAEPSCDILTNWLKNDETTAARASNPALVTPSGRYVLKVWTQTREKVMINVCEESRGLLADPSAAPGGLLLLPHAASSPREDVDLRKQPCRVVDVTFGRAALGLAERSALFARHLHAAALNAAQTVLGVPLQRQRVATPKLKSKGSPHPFRLAAPGDAGVRIEEQQDVLRVTLTGVAADGVRFHLAQDYLQVDLKKEVVEVQLPAKVSGVRGAPLFSSDQEVAFELLKADNKQADFFLQNQTAVQDPVHTIAQQLDALDVRMDTGSNSSGGSDEEKAASDNAQEDDYFVDCSQNNNNTEKEQTDKLDNDEDEEEEEFERKNTKLNNNINKRHLRILAAKTRSISESSDDWSMCQSPCKGILKSSFSISGDLAASLELSDLSEETTREMEESVSSVKKSVSFSDVISKQLFRPDSSILGQRKKNQRKARNKRKATQRKMSESEEAGSEAEKDGHDMMFDIDM